MTGTQLASHIMTPRKMANLKDSFLWHKKLGGSRPT